MTILADRPYIVSDARVGVRLADGDCWSDKYSGYIVTADGRLRKPYIYRGRPANRYAIEVVCSGCGGLFPQDVNNQKKSQNAFCSPSCRSNFVKMQSVGNKMAKKRGDRGHHVLIKQPHHPRADRHGYVYEHVLIIEREIGRYLYATERVHHIDFVKHNNAPSNLLLCQSDSEHFLIHGSLNECVAGLLAGGSLFFDREARRYRVKEGK